MKITTAIRLTSPCKLRDREQPDHVQVTFDQGGKVSAVRWKYGADDRLYSATKRRGGVWDYAGGGWTFPDNQAHAQVVFEEVCKKYPSWIVVGQPGQQLMEGVRFARIALPSGHVACLISALLPHFSSTPSVESSVESFELIGKNKVKKLGLLVGRPEQLVEFVDEILQQGAKEDDSLSERFSISSSAVPLHVKVNGWAVEISCNLHNPQHLLLMSSLQDDRHYGRRDSAPWDGNIHTTRKLWSRWKKNIEEIGLSREGADPERELSVPTTFVEAGVPGWNVPAPNGHLLHNYQKTGAQFCASRGMRALIGDEMGVGKTAQAIAAAESVNARRVVVVCPASARYVWDREIRGWSSGGSIQHISDQLSTLDSEARWHIVTYDQLVSKSENWKLKNLDDEKAFLQVFPGRRKEIIGNNYPKKILLKQHSSLKPNFADAKRCVAWERMQLRLSGNLLLQISSAGQTEQLLVILDEAHRVKNRDAKRTHAIRKVTEGNAQVLLLTGTPLRNNEHEAAVLVGILDAAADSVLSQEKGYTIQDLKDYLSHFMIRRTKQEVLPELPPKTRQQIDLDHLDENSIDNYFDALEYSRKLFSNALASGASMAVARQKMMGGLESARVALGLAKVRGGEVSRMVADVVDEKGCCVVFCAHHSVSDELSEQLTKAKIKSAVVDGRTSQKDRARIVDEFQSGLSGLNVFIGGINSAGEAITLTRADTVIFVELDYVPAALQQAEDRIHRVGQKSNCHIVHLVARMDGENLDQIMIDLLGSKLDRIGLVLDEDRSNILSSGHGEPARKGSIQLEILTRLQPTQDVLPSSHTISSVRQQVVTVELPDSSAPSQLPQVNVEVAPQAIPAPVKRGRGRPKLYTDGSAPTSSARSKKSLHELTIAGGKRLMLRLSPEAYAALKCGMDLAGKAEETEAINQAVIAWAQRLALNAGIQQ